METFAPNASGRLWECFMGAKGEGLRFKREDVFCFFFLGGVRGFEIEMHF